MFHVRVTDNNVRVDSSVSVVYSIHLVPWGVKSVYYCIYRDGYTTWNRLSGFTHNVVNSSEGKCGAVLYIMTVVGWGRGILEIPTSRELPVVTAEKTTAQIVKECDGTVYMNETGESKWEGKGKT